MGIGGVRDFDGTVGSIVPSGFDAYARVFHPAALSGSPRSTEVRSAAVAAANGRVMHLAAEWGSITGSWDYQYRADQLGVWNTAPATGSLAPETAARLAPFSA